LSKEFFKLAADFMVVVQREFAEGRITKAQHDKILKNLRGMAREVPRFPSPDLGPYPEGVQAND
jgi:hypothetical protein